MLDTKAIAEWERCSERSDRMTLELAFLAPQVVTEIQNSRVRKGMGLTNFAEFHPDVNAEPTAGLIAFRLWSSVQHFRLGLSGWCGRLLTGAVVLEPDRGRACIRDLEP